MSTSTCTGTKGVREYSVLHVSQLLELIGEILVDQKCDKVILHMQ